MLEHIIEKYYESLHENDRFVLSVILNNKQECSRLTIEDMALRCNTSKSSLFRLTQKLGFSGFSEFKVFLKQSIEKVERPEMSLVSMYKHDVFETLKLLDENEYIEIIDDLLKAEQIYIFGTGSIQRTVARELQRQIILFEQKPVIHLNDQLEFEAHRKKITDRSMFIVISFQGNNKLAIEMLKQILPFGVKTLAICGNKLSKIGQLSKHQIHVHITDMREHGNFEFYETMVPMFLAIDRVIREMLEYKFDVLEQKEEDYLRISETKI